jgi:hypothetical protein
METTSLKFALVKRAWLARPTLDLPPPLLEGVGLTLKEWCDLSLFHYIQLP